MEAVLACLVTLPSGKRWMRPAGSLHVSVSPKLEIHLTFPADSWGVGGPVSAPTLRLPVPLIPYGEQTTISKRHPILMEL